MRGEGRHEIPSPEELVLQAQGPGPADKLQEPFKDLKVKRKVTSELCGQCKECVFRKKITACFKCS